MRRKNFERREQKLYSERWTKDLNGSKREKNPTRKKCPGIFYNHRSSKIKKGRKGDRSQLTNKGVEVDNCFVEDLKEEG